MKKYNFKILHEAVLDYYTQKEKMRGYEDGTRKPTGIPAMSDEKLVYNLRVCIQEDYTKAKKLIAAEIAKRDSLKNECLDYSTEKINFLIAIGSLEHLAIITAANKDFAIIEKSAFNTYSTFRIHISKMFLAMMLSMLFSYKDIAEKLRDELISFGFSLDEICTVLKDATTNKELIKKFDEAKEKYFSKTESLEEDIEKHDELNPKLWTKEKTLKPEVEEKIKLIVNEFLDNLEQDEIKVNLKDVILVGSNCSYNYTKDSDLDIHLLVDVDSLNCPDNLYPKLYSAYRSIFNSKLDIDFYGIPVEIYVETDDNSNISNGKYSVVKHKWIKEPVAQNIPEIDKEKFNKEFKVWEDRYNKLVDSIDTKELKEGQYSSKIKNNAMSTAGARYATGAGNKDSAFNDTELDDFEKIIANNNFKPNNRMIKIMKAIYKVFADKIEIQYKAEEITLTNKKNNKKIRIEIADSYNVLVVDEMNPRSDIKFSVAKMDKIIPIISKALEVSINN